MFKKLFTVLFILATIASILYLSSSPSTAAVPMAATTGSVVKEITFYGVGDKIGVKYNVRINFSSNDTARSVSDAKCRRSGYSNAKQEIVDTINKNHGGLSTSSDPSVGNGYEMDRELWWHTEKGLNDHSHFCN